jgi:CBS domain-containing protein
MQVRDGMSSMVLTIGPGHTLREASKAMSQRRVGAAVVLDPDAAGPGILTERDVLDSVGLGQDPDVEVVGEHLTSNVVYASPGWSLEEAAVAMVRGGFRHLVVMEHGEIIGILSVRDVVRCWTDDGAICDVPESAAAAIGAAREG